MMDDENKVKQFFKNNFLYFIIFFACCAYVAYGLVSLDKTGKSILEIIGQGFVIFIVGYLICQLFSMQGLMSGDKKKEVVETNELHSKCVTSIDSKINELDEWCEQENTKALLAIRKQILNRAGLSYESCFDEFGVAKEVSFEHTSLLYLLKDSEGNITGSMDAKQLKEEKPDIYKIELKKVRDYNRRQDLKAKALKKAVKVKITPLTTDAITASSVKVDDPHNFGKDRQKFQKQEARSDLISKLILGVVFSYFSVSFVFGWAQIISSLVQVGIFLLLGGIKWVQSYYFVVEYLRKITVKKINYLQKFACDKNLAITQENTQQITNLGGSENANINS